jgi:hypothetical protein
MTVWRSLTDPTMSHRCCIPAAAPHIVHWNPNGGTYVDPILPF